MGRRRRRHRADAASRIGAGLRPRSPPAASGRRTTRSTTPDRSAAPVSPATSIASRLWQAVTPEPHYITMRPARRQHLSELRTQRLRWLEMAVRGEVVLEEAIHRTREYGRRPGRASRSRRGSGRRRGHPRPAARGWRGWPAAPRHRRSGPATPCATGRRQVPLSVSISGSGVAPRSSGSQPPPRHSSRHRAPSRPHGQSSASATRAGPRTCRPGRRRHDQRTIVHAKRPQPRGEQLRIGQRMTGR